MKKILSFLLIAMLTLGLSACNQGEKPEKVVEDYFSAVKSADVETIGKLVEDGLSDENKEVSEEEKELVKKIFDLISVDVVGDAKIEGKTAKVDTKITAPDMKMVFENVLAKLIPKVMEDAFKGKEMSEEELDKLFKEHFLKQLDSKDLTMVTSEVELNLVKKDNSWVIVEDEVLENAVSGGFAKQLKELENKFK